MSNGNAFQYRPHTGILKDAMVNAKSYNNLEELCVHLREMYKLLPHNVDVSPTTIVITKYGTGIDERVGWDTHIVILPTFGVVGYLDCMPEEYAAMHPLRISVVEGEQYGIMQFDADGGVSTTRLVK